MPEHFFYDALVYKKNLKFKHLEGTILMPKYLIDDDHGIYQTDSINDDHLNQCILDGDISIFRFNNGKFEYLIDLDEWETVNEK